MRVKETIDNTMDTIDSRDIIARLAELADKRESALDNFREGAIHEDADDWVIPVARATADSVDERVWSDDWNEEQEQEYQALKTLDDEGDSEYSDWTHGVGLIRDSYFITYAQELADDMHGSAVRNAEWPFDYIDWVRAADALQMDYSIIKFGDVTYWVRD